MIWEKDNVGPLWLSKVGHKLTFDYEYYMHANFLVKYHGYVFKRTNDHR